MRIQKQLNRHQPDKGIYGDCHRTAIACVLDLDPKDVPHFMDKLPNGSDAPDVWGEIERWLNARGLTQINIAFPGAVSLRDVLEAIEVSNASSPGLVYLLGGTSRNNLNHTVVCCGGEIVCDPSLDNSGIIGPMSHGYWCVTFFGALQATHRS
jgi:hypothetical protein